MWPFRRKPRLTMVPHLLPMGPHLEAASEEAELDRLRLAALAALEKADLAAQAALTAISKGAPGDCREVLVTRDAVHEANNAVEAWIKAGGL